VEGDEWILGPFENGPLLDRAVVAPIAGNFTALQHAIPAYIEIKNRRFNEPVTTERAVQHVPSNYSIKYLKCRAG
jgi:hypothetical protein